MFLFPPEFVIFNNNNNNIFNHCQKHFFLFSYFSVNKKKQKPKLRSLIKNEAFVFERGWRKEEKERKSAERNPIMPREAEGRARGRGCSFFAFG